MELALKTEPHCENCIHLVREGDKVVCKGQWQGEVHPEHAGHKKHALTKSIAIYEVTCPWYFPANNARITLETAIREIGQELHAVKDYARRLEEEIHKLKREKTELVKEEKPLEKELKEKKKSLFISRRPVKRSARLRLPKKTKKKPVKKPKNKRVLKKRSLQRRALKKRR
jgi:hypothetical protein